MPSTLQLRSTTLPAPGGTVAVCPDSYGLVARSLGLQFPFSAQSTNNTQTLYPAGNFTFEARVLITAYTNSPPRNGVTFTGSATRMFIGLAGTTGTFYGWRLTQEGRRLYFYNYGTGTGFSVGSTDLPLQTWFHVAVRAYWGAGTTHIVEVYMNGSLLGSTTFAQRIPDVRVLNLGHPDDARTVATLYGAMDEVRLWSVARTPAEIAANWALRNSAVTGITSGNMAAMWSLDDNRTSSIPLFVDGSGNGRDLRASTNQWENDQIATPPTL